MARLLKALSDSIGGASLKKLNSSNMYPDNVIKQFFYETEGWCTLILFLEEENNSFKTRLAQLVTDKVTDSDLEMAERLNDEFTSFDKVVQFLKDEIKKQRTLLQKDLYVHNELLEEVIQNQKRIKEDTNKAKEIFDHTLQQFKNYLAISSY
jgi:uncharacterized phage infection (PIP) family protein YhgE